MGTHADFRGNSTPFEYALSHTMQDLWLAFAKDPESGLLGLGWPKSSVNGSVMVLGEDGSLMHLESMGELDAGCSAK